MEKLTIYLQGLLFQGEMLMGPYAKNSMYNLFINFLLFYSMNKGYTNALNLEKCRPTSQKMDGRVS